MTRDVRLSALHRGDLWAPVRRGMKQSGFTVCELLASAHSSGGLGFRSLPGAWLRATRAGRRIPLRLWLVSGDALGERDEPNIGYNRNLVKTTRASADARLCPPYRGFALLRPAADLRPGRLLMGHLRANPGARRQGGQFGRQSVDNTPQEAVTQCTRFFLWSDEPIGQHHSETMHERPAR